MLYCSYCESDMYSACCVTNKPKLKLKCVFGGEYEEEQLTKNIRLEYWLYFFLVLFHMHFCEKRWGVTTYPGLGQVVTRLGASCHITIVTVMNA